MRTTAPPGRCAAVGPALAFRPPVVARRAATLDRLAGRPDTKTVIETAVTRFLQEVPTLQPLTLVVGLELRGRGDVQLYRVEVPGPKITKSEAPDARVRLSLPRATFNELAEHGTVKAWREAFEHGLVKASGPTEIQRLIVNVVEKQEQRARTRKVRQ